VTKVRGNNEIPGSVYPARPFNRLIGGMFVGMFIQRKSLIEGIENLYEAQDAYQGGARVLLICNHLSYADSHIIEQMLCRHGFRDFAWNLFYIAGQKTYQTMWRRFFTAGVNTIKVIQASANESMSIKRRQAIESFRSFKKTITKHPVLIFPEGTRSRTGRIGTGVPTLVNYIRRNFVLPMAIQGSEIMLGVGHRFPKPGKVVLRFGKPFIADNMFQKSKPEEIRLYLERIADLLDPSYT